MFVAHPRIGLVLLGQIGPHRVLKGSNGLRIPDMILAADPELIFTADIERITVDRSIAEGVSVAMHAFFGDLL